MNLSIRELNELIYCIGIARMHGQLLGTSVADNLEVALRDELDDRLEMELWDNTLLDGLKDDYLTTSKQDEQRYKDSHYVSNEEADEDAKVTRIHIEEDVFAKILRNITETVKPKGVTQSILDYVEFKGEASYTEMQNFYRITFGSNSFSHILISLVVPYKNRLTRRYLHKKANGKYVIKIAGLHNWVVNEY
jgi:hypothetical protein